MGRTKGSGVQCCALALASSALASRPLGQRPQATALEQMQINANALASVPLCLLALGLRPLATGHRPQAMSNSQADKYQAIKADPLIL